MVTTQQRERIIYDSEKLVRLLRDADVMEPLDIQRIKILQRKFDSGQKLSLKEFGLLRQYSMQLVEAVFNSPILYNELRRQMVRKTQGKDDKFNRNSCKEF